MLLYSAKSLYSYLYIPCIYLLITGMEDLLLESFQENLMRTLQENDPFSDVTIHLGRKVVRALIICHIYMSNSLI